MRENDRSERPQNRTDAKPCLSDVYKMSTRAKRRQTDVRLSGRSMVEMLGVLAIIGVLSVGSISGYSKAMMKYKLNKQAEQLSQLINVIYIYKEQWHFNVYTDLIPYYIKMNLIPEEMIKNSQTRIYDSFNNSIKISNNNAPSYNELLLGISLPKEDSVRFENCQNIFQVVKTQAEKLLYIIATGRSNEESISSQRYYGDAYCNRTNCLKHLTIENIYDICQVCQNQQSCGYNIIWRI